MRTRRNIDFWLFAVRRGRTDFEKVLQLAPSTPGVRQEILATKQAINEADTYIPPVQVPSAPHRLTDATCPLMHVEHQHMSRPA